LDTGIFVFEDEIDEKCQAPAQCWQAARVTTIFVVAFDNDEGSMMTLNNNRSTIMLDNDRSTIVLNHNAAMVAVVVAIVRPLRRCGNADTAVASRAADATGESR
jgi:hypothetical protein